MLKLIIDQKLKFKIKVTKYGRGFLSFIQILEDYKKTLVINEVLMPKSNQLTKKDSLPFLDLFECEFVRIKSLDSNQFRAEPISVYILGTQSRYLESLTLQNTNFNYSIDFRAAGKALKRLKLCNIYYE